MMKLQAVAALLPFLADAVKVARRKASACPDGLTNRFPADMEPSYNISQDVGVSPLTAIWDTEKLRAALKDDADWQVGMHWLLSATFYSDSTEDREFGFAGPNGGFMKIVVPAGEQDGKPIEVSSPVAVPADRLEFQYIGVPGPAEDHWTTGKIFMTNICLAPQACANYQCPDHSDNTGAAEGKFGYSEVECCTPKVCKDIPVECAPATQYKEHENYSKGLLGWNVDGCCTKIHCPVNLCENMTTHSDKGDNGLLGSTPEECCEERLCATFKGCDGTTSKPLSIYIDGDESTPRLGSTVGECCEPIFCNLYEGCLPATDFKLIADADTVKGSDKETCCDVLKCEEVTCPNNTKWRPGPNPNETVGSTIEQCCEKVMCSSYSCSNESLQYLVNHQNRQGNSDEECCERKSCLNWQCSDDTKFVKRPDQTSADNTDRLGWSDEECCDQVFCLAQLCDPSTMWKPKEGVEEKKVLGSTFEQCCDKIFCEDFVCDTDENQTGWGTKWYKKKDTNTYKWQGSTDEECCHPIFCSQYTTSHDTRWKRKENGSLQGSTDLECYDPRLCSDYCCADDSKVLIPHAEKHQGSTDAECCMDREERDPNWHGLR
eukprot:gb/GFBE01067854.1/.p1 GENE.gb/GFBE01067854.1/~~gb/GFBE01067854.1/.p1  ORF type:complete len:603 (+),score=174.57 gb/GFBE01067854.1/:1-1809(+)